MSRVKQSTIAKIYIAKSESEYERLQILDFIPLGRKFSTQLSQ